MITKEEERLLADFMEKRRQAVIAMQKSKRLRASGLSASLLTTERSGDIFLLVDKSGTFEFQEYGRRPGGYPPFKKIYEWLQYKKYGLSYTNDKQRRSLAWAISKKIQQRGTFTFRRGQNTGVISQPLAEPNLRGLIDDIAKGRTLEILTDIRRIFK